MPLDSKIERVKKNLSWNQETLNYCNAVSIQDDEFMQLRINKIKKMACNMRPALMAAFVFSPNISARKKAIKTMRLFREILGKSSWKDSIASLVLVITGLIEFVRIKALKAFGREGIIRQPPMRRVTYTR